MKKEEILSLPNLSIAEETQYFIHIHAAEGYTITPYKDIQDIRNFYESECYYFPKFNDFEEYRVITKKQSDEYHNLQKIALEKDSEESQVNENNK